MFKKPFRVSASSPMKSLTFSIPGFPNSFPGSDQRKFKSRLLLAFPSLTEDVLKVILGNKDEVKELKATTTPPSIIYAINDQPSFILTEGLMLPTVYTLWKIPFLVPSLPTHAPVVDRLRGGADFMLPGVACREGDEELAKLGKWNKDDAGSVHIVDTKICVAVGNLLVDSAYIRREGLSGRGLKLVHVVGDELWALGTKYDATIKGLYPDAVLERPTLPSLLPTSETAATESPATSQVQDVKVQPVLPDADQQPSTADGEKDEAASETAMTTGEAGGEGTDRVSKEVMDAALISACAKALHGIPEKTLPMLTSTYYSSYVLPLHPKEFVFDIKLSSFKKVSKLLQVLQKQGLFVIKDSGGVSNLTQVNRKHTLFVENAPSEFDAPVGPAKPTQGPAGGPQVQDVFVPKGVQATLFGEAQQRFFTADEISKAVWMYAAKEKIAEGRNIALNEFLASIVNIEVGQKLPASEVITKVIKAMQPMFLLKGENGETVLKKGNVKPVLVQAKDRSGGKKYMTHIIGLENVGLDPEQVAQKAQHKFASATTTNKLEAKNSGYEVLIQGNFLQDVGDWLGTEYGLYSRFIVLEDKRKHK